MESVDSSPVKVGRHLTPPPIIREVGHFQDEEVKPPKPSVTKLMSQVKKLRTKNMELSDRNAELGVELAELRHDFNTFSREMCSKIKRACAEMGKEDKYYVD